MSTNLGIIYPMETGTVGYYAATNNDNVDFWIDYPNNNQITVTLNTFGGVAMVYMHDYCIFLNLIGIEDININNETINHKLILPHSI